MGRTNASRPPQLAFSQITTGQHHTCGVAENGRVLCWGADSNGSLGCQTPTQLGAIKYEFFGLRETPTVAGGRQRVLLHLLAPNGRPAQVTQDLASFWASGYAAVRKELRGRYPKHGWPEDPRG